MPISNETLTCLPLGIHKGTSKKNLNLTEKRSIDVSVVGMGLDLILFISPLGLSGCVFPDGRHDLHDFLLPPGRVSSCQHYMDRYYHSQNVNATIEYQLGCII